jgi:hypothetical protein
MMRDLGLRSYDDCVTGLFWNQNKIGGAYGSG